jgi:hypothetical protein
MRNVSLFCALLLLTSCGKTPDEANQRSAGAKQPPPARLVPDGSPIIISDGSVKLNQPEHFRIHRTKDGPAVAGGEILPAASVKIVGHAPTTLGYLCDPGIPGTAGTCANSNATNCATGADGNTRSCTVVLSTLSKWSLELFDTSSASNAVATLKWDGSGETGRIKLYLPNGYTVQGAGEGTTTSGVNLLPSLNTLTSAKLTVNGAPPAYKFTCSANQACLTIGYYCDGASSPCGQ